MILPIISWDQAYNRNGDRTLPRTVVNVIRTYVDNTTLTGWVKAETLVRHTGLQERAVRGQIAANVKAGWLEVVESGRAGRANTYRLKHPTLQQNAGCSEPDPAAECRVDEVPPCKIMHVHPAAECIPTTPRTSPQREVPLTTQEIHPATECRVPDPFGVGGSDPATERTASESHPATECRVDISRTCRVNPFCDKPQPCDCET